MSVRSIVRAVGRERAVIGGIAIAVAQAAVAGQITKATAVPVIGGIVLRFLVAPANEVVPRALVDQAHLSIDDQMAALAVDPTSARKTPPLGDHERARIANHPGGLS